MNITTHLATASFLRTLGAIAFVLANLTGCALFYPDDPSNLSVGTVIDDKSTGLLAERQIHNANSDLANSHIVVTSYNGVALITGQVASDVLKKAAEDAIKDIRTIKRIHNELEISGPTSYIARTNDGTLTTAVKARLVAEKNFDSNHLKIVTENGVVYLMGLVTRAESDIGVQVARNVYGVQRVVTVFEFLN